MRKLGRLQLLALDALKRHGKSGSWFIHSRPATERLLETLEKRGLAYKDAAGVYRITSDGRAVSGLGVTQ